MVQLVVVASNQCGVLARVTSVISGVGANIVRCHVAEIPDSAMSVLTFALQANEPQTKAITRKLSRLVEVAEVVTDAKDASDSPDVSTLGVTSCFPTCSPSAA